MNQTAILETAPVGFVPSYYLYVVVVLTIISIISLVYTYKSKTGIKFEGFWKAMAFVIIISGTITLTLALAPEVLTKFLDWLSNSWANL